MRYTTRIVYQLPWLTRSVEYYNFPSCRRCCFQNLIHEREGGDVNKNYSVTCDPEARAYLSGSKEAVRSSFKAYRKDSF